MPEKISVVLVDDSRAALAQLDSLVSQLDDCHVVGTAGDGLMGVTIVSQRKPDLVLMDIIMPHLDGISALRMIRANNPDARVAMVSSVGGTQSRAVEAFRLGAIQVLAKPVDPEQLAALVEGERRHKAQKRAAEE